MADKDKEMTVEEYGKNFSEIVCGGFIALSVSLGTKTGLLDHMTKLSEPADITTIASETNLKERYVREWLGCMVAAKIVFMEGKDKYFIPEKYRGSLGMALYSPFLAVLAEREDAVATHFKKETDPGFTVYDQANVTRFFNALDNERAAMVNDRIDKGVLPAVRKYQEKFGIALEVGCGSGIFSIALAKRNQDSKVIGIDFTEEAMKRAKDFAKKQNVQNVEFLQHDVTKLPVDWACKFDLVLIFDVLHDMPDPVKAISEMKRVMKKDGLLMIVDPKVSSYHGNNAGSTLAGAFYSISTSNCLVNSLSREPAAGLGIGWGAEDEEEFLKKQNLVIKHKSDFTFNEYSAAFLCSKKEEKNGQEKL